MGARRLGLALAAVVLLSVSVLGGASAYSAALSGVVSKAKGLLDVSNAQFR
jgi:hypothetical protein